MAGGRGGGDRRRWGWLRGGDPNGFNRLRFSLWYVLAALVVLLVVQLLLARNQVRQVPLAGTSDSFYSQLAAGNIAATRISETGVTWTTRAGAGYAATLPSGYDTTSLVTRLQTAGVQVTASQPNPLVGLLLQWLLPILALVVVWLLLVRRMGGAGAGALNLARNRVRIVNRNDMTTTFADVAGVDEAVEELREIVDFLRNPSRYQRLGGRIPKGVLLMGPPGCGKTLLARAVAGEAGVPFFFMSGSEFVEMFVGLGAARVRELFQRAKENAPCLVFLDELDTIGKSRGAGVLGSFGSHDEREQTLNQLLVEMDGFDASKGVIIMAATNRADVLDPALVRPGRFDRQVVVDWPDIRGREAILRVHTRTVTLDPTVDLRTLAARTPGFTGADLANVVNEAALLAARRDRASIGMGELEEAIDRSVGGLERRSRVMSDREKERVATHEMGHALVALRVEHADPVHRVSIIPRGAAALGMTLQRPTEDRYLMTEPELKDRLAVLLGGRSSEELVFGEASTSAQNDLERATDIARAMVVEYGMSPQIGPLSFGREGPRGGDGQAQLAGGRPEVSDELARLVDQEVARIVGEAHERALRILRRDRGLLDSLARLLMANEVIEGADLLRHVRDGEPVALPVPGAGAGGADRVPGGDARERRRMAG